LKMLQPHPLAMKGVADPLTPNFVALDQTVWA